MALASTGYISLGGTDTDRSVAQELDDGGPNFTSTISLNDTNVRELAERTGSSSISLDHLRGKSYVLASYVVTSVNVPDNTGYGLGFAGYRKPSTGSITPNNILPFLGNAELNEVGAFEVATDAVHIWVDGSHDNSGWTKMVLDGTHVLERTAASYSVQGSVTSWAWGGTGTIIFPNTTKIQTMEFY